MWGVGGHGAEWSRAAVRALGSWIGRVWLRRLRVLARDVLLGASLAVRLPGESQIADPCISYLLAQCVNHFEDRPDLER